MVNDAKQEQEYEDLKKNRDPKTPATAFIWLFMEFWNIICENQYLKIYFPKNIFLEMIWTKTPFKKSS